MLIGIIGRLWEPPQWPVGFRATPLRLPPLLMTLLLALNSMLASGLQLGDLTLDATTPTMKRTTTFLVSLLVALCSGTNYVRDLVSSAKDNDTS